MESKASDLKIRFPIATKLMLIIGAIVVVSLGAITYLVNFFESGDVKLKGEDSNFSVNKASATAAENFFRQTQTAGLLFMDMLDSVNSDEMAENQAAAYFFERNPDFGCVALISSDKGGFYYDSKFLNKKFFQKHELRESTFDAFMDSEISNIRKAEGGQSFVINSTGYFDFSSIAISIPWQENGKKQSLVFFTSTETLSDNFGSNASRGSHTSFIINSEGDILVHPDFSLMQMSENISNSVIFKKMLEYNDNGRQINFTDENGVEYFGAYQRLQFAELVVITQVKAEIIYENIVNLTKRNLYLSLAIFFLAILLIWLYSKTISRPLKVLTETSAEIEGGNFDINLETKTHDEIAVLTKSFNHMSKGLAERERLKDSFGKFTNKEVAEKAMKGELTLGGESKNVTIFFSDIRNFTALSEKLAPAQVVEFLNDYMTRMVHCVDRTGGVVDKFIGDAVMAIWGSPISAGSPAMDALNCVISALLMRSALMEFNKTRGGVKNPKIRIGCGINSGEVIAGQIGSKEKMEYTVIGDAVNLASRTESLNKPFGTDILITENTYKLISKLVAVEEMPSVHVKGKSAPIKMYAVVNMPKAKNIPGAGENGPKSLDEVRTLLGIPKPDLTKVDADAKEEKFKID